MKMSRLEKRFVNAPKHAADANIFVDRMAEHIEISGVNECLEVGCGVGFTSLHLARKFGLQVTGVDIDPDQIELAKKHGASVQNLNFQVASAMELPFNEDQFDLVLCYNVLHHVADWLGALHEIKRVLNPGGFLIYGDILTALWLAKFFRVFTRNYGVPTLVELEEFTSKNGLTMRYSTRKSTGLICNYGVVYRN